MDKIGAAPSDMDDWVNRLPNDPRWKEIELGGEGDRSSVPILMINSWYDLSIGPNVAMYEYQSKNAANQTARDNMFMIIAPTTHCNQGQMETEHTVVGQRDMGDARLDYVGLIQKWFDHFLKGIDNGITSQPKVRVYLMGANEWRTYDAWPPPAARYVSYYLESEGKANTAYGDGKLSTEQPAAERTDAFTYDPLRPVPSVGGNICCFPPIRGGAFDQSPTEMRSDVLVYSTPPLTDPMKWPDRCRSPCTFRQIERTPILRSSYWTFTRTAKPTIWMKAFNGCAGARGGTNRSSCDPTTFTRWMWGHS